MTRLIDADAFIEDMKDLYRRAGWSFREIHFSLGDTISNIDNMPTINTVSVIRCKDCKHARVGRNEVDSWRWCKVHRCDFENDYCSWAERKEE